MLSLLDRRLDDLERTKLALDALRAGQGGTVSNGYQQGAGLS